MAQALPFIMMAMTVASTVSQMAGNSQQASASKDAYKEQAKIIDQETALNRAAAAKQNQFVLAKNQARQAAAGVDTSSGSPLEYDLEQAFNAGMQESTIQWEGDLKKRQAKMGAYNVGQALPGAQTGALLQGGSQLASWYGKSSWGKP